MNMNLYSKKELSNEKCPKCGKPLWRLVSVVYAKDVLKCFNDECPTNYPDITKWIEQSRNGRVWFCPNCGQPKMRYSVRKHLFVCWNCVFMLPEKEGVSLKILVEFDD